MQQLLQAESKFKSWYLLTKMEFHLFLESVHCEVLGAVKHSSDSIKGVLSFWIKRRFTSDSFQVGYL